MATFSKTMAVHYSAQQMYHLVNDVEGYPAFIPGCELGRIISRRDQQVEASLTFRYRGISETLVTRNTCVPDRQVSMELVRGPVHHLSGLWAFQPLSDQTCEVTLRLEFELAGWWSGWLSDKMVARSDRLVEVFQDRAHQLYASP